MIFLIRPREEDEFSVIADRIEKDRIQDNHLFLSISKGYENMEKLIEGEKLTGEPCRICGEPHFCTNYDQVGEILREKNICFTCNHWEDNNKMTGRKRIIINGSKFSDGGEVDRKITQGFVGHGGRRFYIKFLETGEVFTTNNLWCQGKISKAFRERMPDNAIYLTKEEYESETKQTN